MTEDYIKICGNCGKEINSLAQMFVYRFKGMIVCDECNKQLQTPDDKNIEPPCIEEKINVKAKQKVSLGSIAFQIILPVTIGLLLYAFRELYINRYKPWLTGQYFIVQLSLFPAFIFFYSIYLCKKYNIWPLSRRMTFKKIIKEFFISVLFTILICLVLAIVRWLSTFFYDVLPTNNKLESIMHTPSSYISIIYIIYAFAIGPVVEEFFYRGFIYNALKKRCSILISVLIQAMIFMFFHNYSLVGRVMMLLLGIALAIVYEKRKSILSPIFIHIMNNGIILIPLLILVLGNFHTPALDFKQASTPPAWKEEFSLKESDRQQDGMQQWQYAIDTWGSKGTCQWKREIVAFEAVCYWFPEDRQACARARLGIVHIYRTSLVDYRRSIIEAEKLLSDFPNQREQCATALIDMGWSYYMICDHQKSREAFDRVINNFSEYEYNLESAMEGLERLNALEGN